MNDLGRIAGGLASGVAQGIGIGQALDQQRGLADERAWGEEVKQQQRRAWQTADLDRARAEATNALQGFLTARQQGLDVDPAPVRDALSKVGVDLRKYTDPAMKSWLRNGFSALKTQQITPETLESFNWRFSDDLNKTRGKTYENDVTLPDGTVLPKGSKIVDTKAAGVLPSASRQGLFLDLEVTAETPDGKRVTYNAPATKNRSSDPDDEVLEIPLDRLVDVMGDDLRRLEVFEQSPEMMAALTSQLYAMGGSLPTAQKREEFEREVGTELVTIQRDAAGNERVVARAPRWNPKTTQRDRQPTAIEEYRGLVKEVGQEEADRIWGGAKGRGSRDLPLSPNQVITQAGAARRAATTYVENRAKADFKLGRDQAAQKQMLADVYAEELAARGLDQTMVDDAAKQTGKRAPRAGTDASSEGAAQPAAAEAGNPDDAELLRLWGQ